MKFGEMLLVAAVTMVVLVRTDAQLTIDATARTSGTATNPASVRFGSIGRKLPLDVKVKIENRNTEGKEENKAIFALTNTGSTDILIPISTNQSVFEAGNQNKSLPALHMRLYVTAGERHETVLHGGCDLYGRTTIHGTISKLHPGESIRVVTIVDFPSQIGGVANPSVTYTAHVTLNEERVATSDGKVLTEANEVGSSISEPFTY